jgi:hypothetical protein
MPYAIIITAFSLIILNFVKNNIKYLKKNEKMVSNRIDKFLPSPINSETIQLTKFFNPMHIK